MVFCLTFVHFYDIFIKMNKKREICMKKVVKFIVGIVLSISFFSFLIGCDGGKYDVVIYSSMEDFRNEKLNEMLKEELPDLKIDLRYLPSGNNAAKVKSEGTSIEADIIMDIDYGYMLSLKNNFADLSGIADFTVFDETLLDESNKFLPLSKFSVAVIVNEAVLGNLPLPQTYDDLTSGQYKQKIVMPNPKASGTGYAFLKGMVALKGEEAAFDYFDNFEKNVSQFTSSGSGPVNNLVRGESAIGIGMVFQAAQENAKGANLKVLNFAEGVPYNVSGFSIINGREEKEAVKKVFNFIATDFLVYDKVHFMPEKIFKDQPDSVIENYPIVNNMDMKGFDFEEKERLLNKWKY